MDLDVMSVVRGPYDDMIIPCSFTVLTWWMADGDDHECGLVGIIALYQGKCPLCEQTLAGLVLNYSVSSDLVR